MRTLAALTAALLLAGACGGRSAPVREYEVIGQIIRIDPAKQEVLLRHQDIVGFMPGMTMPFRVGNGALLEGRTPGDLVTATLVVGENEAYLSALVVTGHAEVEGPPPAPTLTAADMLDPGETVSDGAFLDQQGQPFTMSSLRGHRTALTFVYTRCPLPDFCPLMDRQFAEARKIVAATPHLDDVRFVSVSIDPDHDRPDVLATHARAVGADGAVWRFATGAPADIAGFAKQFGVIAEPQADATITHNLRTAVIDPDGRLVKVVSGNQWTAAELVADLTAAPAPKH